MNIVVIGAGAIGSLVGGFLSQNNSVVLVGRSYQKESIQKNGLSITGKTHRTFHLAVVDSVGDVDGFPDLVILAVKSYDTDKALQDASSLFTSDTLVLSLQNGLDNLQKIEKYVEKQHIFGSVTTHGVFALRPGVVEHTGLGRTVIGSWDNTAKKNLDCLVSLFNEAGIKTKKSVDVRTDIWKKAIINSSINPLTALFGCTNGYLLENPVLEGITKKICYESTAVACSQGVSVSFPLMVRLTKRVIHETSANFSSMLQSVQHKKKTEINEINGVIVRLGQQTGIDVSLNKILTSLITSLHTDYPVI